MAHRLGQKVLPLIKLSRSPLFFALPQGGEP
jgi:hypothetical protein